MGAEKRCTCGVGGDLYRGLHIYYEPPPIPWRSMDWCFHHEDFDGAIDSHDGRYGHAGSEQACRDAIDEMIAEDE